MSSAQTLCFWVVAADPDDERQHEMQGKLQLWFDQSGINITDDQMSKMVGPNSVMRQIINMLKVNLLNTTCSDDCTDTTTKVD